MPILEVELVGEPGIPHSALACRLADAAGGVFKSGKQETWVKVRCFPRDCYAENGGALEEAVRPVFVSVLKCQMPNRDVLKVEIEELTKAVASICGRPEENVHIIYEPSVAGRVSFGGKLVE